MADADTATDDTQAAPPPDIQTPSLNLLGRLGLVLQPGQNGAQNLLAYQQQQAQAQLAHSPQYLNADVPTQTAMMAQITGKQDQVATAGELAGMKNFDVTSPTALQDAAKSGNRFKQDALVKYYAGLQQRAIGNALNSATSPDQPNQVGVAAPTAQTASTPGTAQPPVNSFANAMGFVAKHEGGYVSNDSGKGPTNFGINQEANPDIDVSKLTPDSAAQVIKDRYWKPINGDLLPPATAQVALDTAVNQGVGTAQSMLKASGGDPAKMLQMRRDAYTNLAQKNPDKYLNNLPGWLNRLDDLKTQITPQQSGLPTQGQPQANTQPAQPIGGITSDVMQKLPPDLQANLSRAQQLSKAAFLPQIKDSVDSIVNTVKADPRYLAVTKQNEGQTSNIVDAQKSLAATQSSIGSTKAMLDRLSQLSKKMPDTGGEFIKGAEVMASRNNPFGSHQWESNFNDFNTLNKQIFTNGLAGSIPVGSRFDIPIVKALQAAKEVDPYSSDASRQQVIAEHKHTLDLALQNAQNNFDIQSGKKPSPPDGTSFTDSPEHIKSAVKAGTISRGDGIKYLQKLHGYQ